MPVTTAEKKARSASTRAVVCRRGSSTREQGGNFLFEGIFTVASIGEMVSFQSQSFCEQQLGGCKPAGSDVLVVRHCYKHLRSARDGVLLLLFQ